MIPSMFYFGLFLITSCTLMLQIVQTRILSVVAWYHLAFFAISMAMFGLTAGAVWVYLRRDRFTDKTLSYDLAYHSAAFAVVTGAGLLIQMTLAPVVKLSLASLWTWVELALCMSIPFFFSGIVVSLALTRSPFPIGLVYAVDLAGAALGCLGVLVLLNSTDGPSAVLWIAALGAASALCFAASGVGTKPSPLPPLDSLLHRRGALFIVLVTCAILNGRVDYGLQPLVAKGKFESSSSHVFREWNTYSRVAAYPIYKRKPWLWGPSPKFSPDDLSPIEQLPLNIDGDAGTTAFRFRGDLSEFAFLKYDITNLAYHLPNRKRAGVIGVGGGRDVLSAAVFGFQDITGVEINPIFVKLLTSKLYFADFANLAGLDGVKLVVDEARSWFARTEGRFDIVQMSLIDTWAATGAGAFSLSENGLYTVEAWKMFLDRLTLNGVYSVSRWHNSHDPTETGRMLSLAVAALMELGVSEPYRHIFLATAGNIANLIVARQPFSSSDLKCLEDAASFYEYQVLMSPTTKFESSLLHTIATARSRDQLEDYTSRHAFDLTPPTDDRPFFFNQLPVNKPVQALYFAVRAAGGEVEMAGVRAGNLIATVTLLLLFLISLGLVLATIVIPLRSAIKDAGRKLVVGGTLYFFLIGVGFMAVEIALLQRMSVFLGHPIYSLSVSLFTLILATGIGSLLSDKFVFDSRAKFATWALMTWSYVISLQYWLPDVLLAFDGSELLIRAAVSVASIAPAGLLMGFGFPTGMRLISAVDPKPTPWFWGINGAAGVLASAAAIATSISLGTAATLTAGGTCYLFLIPTVLVFLWPAEINEGATLHDDTDRLIGKVN
jgi:predicted membrane-bound spermidine synthase